MEQISTFKTPTEEEIFKERTRNLEKLLDEAKQEYGHRLEIVDKIIDVTDCFYRESRKEYRAPKSFGKVGRETVVVGYVVRGTEGIPPFISKYRVNEKQDGTKFLAGLRGLYDAAEILTILCIEGMRNTSLFEIYEPMKELNIEGVQGFSRRQLDKIIEKLQQEYGTFDPKVDSFFIFAGNDERLPVAIQLNKLWFSQILQYGSKAPYMMDSAEADLFEKFVRNLPVNKHYQNEGEDRLSLLLKDWRLHNFYHHVPKYDAWKFSSSAFDFMVHKTAAYVKHKGIKPTIYISVNAPPTRKHPEWMVKHVELKPEEAVKIFTSNQITDEIASRPRVEPFSFNKNYNK